MATRSGACRSAASHKHENCSPPGTCANAAARVRLDHCSLFILTGGMKKDVSDGDLLRRVALNRGRRRPCARPGGHERRHQRRGDGREPMSVPTPSPAAATSISANSRTPSSSSPSARCRRISPTRRRYDLPQGRSIASDDRSLCERERIRKVLAINEWSRPGISDRPE